MLSEEGRVKREERRIGTGAEERSVTFHDSIETEFGRVTVVVGEDGAVVACTFGQAGGESTHDPRRCRAAIAQLSEYFAGRRQTFDLPLAIGGTEFEHSVWTALLSIPYGATVSYSDIARRIGRPQAVRAVGAANGKNPIAIIVPCHRVIGAGGSLTGYGGGLDMKRALLELEKGQRTLGF